MTTRYRDRPLVAAAPAEAIPAPERRQPAVTVTWLAPPVKRIS